jgi:hypothetical protein
MEGQGEGRSRHLLPPLLFLSAKILRVFKTLRIFRSGYLESPLEEAYT